MTLHVHFSFVCPKLLVKPVQVGESCLSYPDRERRAVCPHLGRGIEAEAVHGRQRWLERDWGEVRLQLQAALPPVRESAPVTGHRRPGLCFANVPGISLPPATSDLLDSTTIAVHQAAQESGHH